MHVQHHVPVRVATPRSAVLPVRPFRPLMSVTSQFSLSGPAQTCWTNNNNYNRTMAALGSLGSLLAARRVGKRAVVARHRRRFCLAAAKAPAEVQPATFEDRVEGALWGMHIGDALAMPTHWYYGGRAQVQMDYGKIIDYVKPRMELEDSVMALMSTGGGGEGPGDGDIIGSMLAHGKKKYWTMGSFHYHCTLDKGENTVDADLVRLCYKSLAENGGQLEPMKLRMSYAEFMTTPGSHNDCYMLTAHRMFFANRKRGLPLDLCPDNDDYRGNVDSIDGLPMTIPVALATAHLPREEARELIASCVGVTRNSQLCVQYASLLADMFHAILTDTSLLKVFEQYGADFEQAMLANANCGGENVDYFLFWLAECMLMGALLGAVHGSSRIPQRFKDGCLKDSGGIARDIQAFVATVKAPLPQYRVRIRTIGNMYGPYDGGKWGKGGKGGKGGSAPKGGKDGAWRQKGRGQNWSARPLSAGEFDLSSGDKSEYAEAEVVASASYSYVSKSPAALDVVSPAWSVRLPAMGSHLLDLSLERGLAALQASDGGFELTAEFVAVVGLGEPVYKGSQPPPGLQEVCRLLRVGILEEDLARQNFGLEEAVQGSAADQEEGGVLCPRFFLVDLGSATRSPYDIDKHFQLLRSGPRIYVGQPPDSDGGMHDAMRQVTWPHLEEDHVLCELRLPGARAVFSAAPDTLDDVGEAGSSSAAYSRAGYELEESFPMASDKHECCRLWRAADLLQPAPPEEFVEVKKTTHLHGRPGQFPAFASGEFKLVKFWLQAALMRCRTVAVATTEGSADGEQVSQLQRLQLSLQVADLEAQVNGPQVWGTLAGMLRYLLQETSAKEGRWTLRVHKASGAGASVRLLLQPGWAEPPPYLVVGPAALKGEWPRCDQGIFPVTQRILKRLKGITPFEAFFARMSAYNDSERNRYVLVLRFWHPSLTTEERRAIHLSHTLLAGTPDPEKMKAGQEVAGAGIPSLYESS
ncbi:unnamed protein product [Polarella glacialis]|uniref:Uncharacterized protein n=1 Tax=Polarella glacialis TaxID=89957 RepID=A0A813FTF0_POLGL|nr:unnamed protein product [Polarella glacialis]